LLSTVPTVCVRLVRVLGLVCWNLVTNNDLWVAEVVIGIKSTQQIFCYHVG